MHGFTKVAALLSSTWAAAFVIPPSHPSSGVITYKPLDASVKFLIDESDATSRHPVFEFSVSRTNRRCGETNVKLNGQLLESEWEGKEAHGSGYLDIYSEHEAYWSITCLYGSAASDDSFNSDGDVVHLLRLRFGHGQATEGFMISYKQAGEAAIVRFSPHVIPEAEVISTAHEWRQASTEFDNDLFMNHKIEDEHSSFSSSLWHGSQNFLSTVNAFKGRLKEKFLSFTACHKDKAHIIPSKSSALSPVPFLPLGNETRSVEEVSDTSEVSDTLDADQLQVAGEKISETAEVAQDASTADRGSSPTSQSLDGTSTLPYLSAAETRSLHTPESAYSLPAAEPSPASSAPHFELNYRALKIFGLTLILLSVLVFCLLRCKDPRWCAERAARREEQRTKRLYKLAARKHKIKTFLGNVRTRFLKLKLASNRALMWNEKQTEASDEREILETGVGNNHQAIDNGVINNIAAAEEGRNDFEYEAESSQRRQSVSTLPGYESDRSQLPPYEAHRTFGTSNLVNGGAFISTDVDSNPDSSVVSTSPRFSRDGTNSDFDEKFEALSLDQNFSVEQCR